MGTNDHHFWLAIIISSICLGSQMSEEQAQTLLERRAVVALSVPLFTRNIWKNNFLQAALGAELRLQGCSGSALDALNTMGLCQNKDTVRLLLHRLRNNKKSVSTTQQWLHTVYFLSCYTPKS